MSKKENVSDTQQIKNATFIKTLGHNPAMEVPASAEALNSFKASHHRTFHVFTVPRDYPVCDFQNLPRILLERTFSFTAQPGEFLVFQLVVWTPDQALGNLRITSPDCPLPWRCFNLNAGQYLNLRSHTVQPLWLGVEIPRNAMKSYKLKFQISTANCPPCSAELPLTVAGKYLPDGGENDGCRLARLRWLDSDIGQEDTVFPPYHPVTRQNNVLSWLGHSLELGDNGLPRQINSHFHNGQLTAAHLPLLHEPVSFITEHGENFTGNLIFSSESPTRITWEVTGKIGNIPACLKGSLDFDGTLKYRLLITPRQKENRSFILHLKHCENNLFCGLNRHGGPCPEQLQWYWDSESWQDGYWVGSQNGGMLLKLCDARTNSPLVNAYYHFFPLHLPAAWNNSGRGGITLHKTAPDILSAQCFSGEISLRPDHDLDFSFEMRITPFHETEQERFFTEHFYHPCMHSFILGEPDPLENADFDQLKHDGVTCLNIHHAVGMNPIINYPFTTDALERLKTFTDKAHQNGLKVIFYYTIRELTVHCPEFWAFRSLGDEIFFPGPGAESRPCTNPAGPHEWLCRKLKRKFLPAWAEVIKNGAMSKQTDIALETTHGTRLENFYLEGLRFLLEKIPLDGLYLDDSDLSAEGFRRMRRIFRSHGVEHPIIDFHAWNPFSFTRANHFGNNSVICRDIEKLPYITDLWLGEGMNYELASYDYFLTEISGLPFGLTGEMLHKGENSWRGLLFGMTSRYGWGGDPRPIWKFFKTFGTKGLKIDLLSDPPFELAPGLKLSHFTNTSGNEGYAIASWNQTDSFLKLPFNAVLPEISGFQSEMHFEKGETMTIQPGMGCFLQKEP